MKKTVYLVQANAVFGEKIKTTYLPYAAGCLAAYAWDDEAVRESYSLGRFIFTREEIDTAISSMQQPYLVGFSCYIWNMEYNRLFAKKLKEKYPDVLILFGGHNVKPDGSDLLEDPFVDFVLHGEGERSFKALLLSLLHGSPLNEVGNLSYREGAKIITTHRVISEDITSYPSPYLKGYFDDIVNSKEYALSVIWETNRGCPNQCAFCDWGLLKAKVRQFPAEKINAELEWFVKNQIEYVYCADANFGSFARDTLLADKMIEANRTFGYPKMFKTNYTKNKDDVVFEISHKLISNKMGKSPTLSFQSLNDEVLKNIGRSNMELKHFKALMEKYGKAGIPVYSELILGLPGETYESFASGMCRLIECDQHTCIGVYPCELLPNSLLGSERYIREFGIRTVRTGFTQYHVQASEKGVAEYSNIVTATDSMSVEDWKRAYLFSVCVQTFHNLALTRAVAIYLYHEKQISYRYFYEELIKWLACKENQTDFAAVYREVEQAVTDITNAKASFSILYGEEEKLEWSMEEYLFIRLVKLSDSFYQGLSRFLALFDIDREIAAELLKYQAAIVKKPTQRKMTCELQYDFYNYFKRIYTGDYRPLENIENRLEVDDRAYRSWDEYARINVWFGRRDDAQLYTGKRNTVMQIVQE